MKNNRVKLGDSMTDAIAKMSEGNPGAVRVLVALAQKDDGLGFVECLKLDDYGIYGARIWMCFKDLCHESTENLHMLLKNNMLEADIGGKCEQDEMFEKEWNYYGKDN